MAGYDWHFMIYSIVFVGPWLFVLVPSTRFPVLTRCEMAIAGSGVLTAFCRIWQGEVETAAGWLLAAAVAMGFASMNERPQKE